MKRAASDDQVPFLSLAEHARVFTQVLASPVFKGPIIRRPSAVNIAERFDFDTAGYKAFPRLRCIYGAGTVLMRLFPNRQVALLLDSNLVYRLLHSTP